MYTEDRAKELRKDPHEPLPSKLQPAVQGGAKGLKHQQRFGDKHPTMCQALFQPSRDAAANR